MASATETTPLVGSSSNVSSAASPNFYFLHNSNSLRDKEIEPTTEEDEAIPSRPVTQTVTASLGMSAPVNGNVLAPAPAATMVKKRSAPIKVEPKVFFSNERTFIAWMHTSVLLASASIAILAFAKANLWSQLYGVLLLPVAITFIVYATMQYTRRSFMIRHKHPGPYEDVAGPVVLGVMLMLSIIAQFGIKLYEMEV